MERIRHPDYLTDEGFEVAKVLVEKEAEITNPEAVQPPEYTFEKREGVDLATEVKGTRQTPIPDIFFEKSLLQTFYVYANPAALTRNALRHWMCLSKWTMHQRFIDAKCILASRTGLSSFWALRVVSEQR